MSLGLAAMATAEVRDLHAFFAVWFRVGVPHPDFGRLEKALAPGFRMVTPDGQLRERQAVIEAVRGARDSRPADFAIVIADPHPVFETAGMVLLEFIEEQYRDGGTTRRRSTALFTPDVSAPRGVLWCHLHETWTGVR